MSEPKHHRLDPTPTGEQEAILKDVRDNSPYQGVREHAARALAKGKPIPTGEPWTVEYVSRIANKKGFQEIVALHNAALAVAYKQGYNDCDCELNGKPTPTGEPWTATPSEYAEEGWQIRQGKEVFAEGYAKDEAKRIVAAINAALAASREKVENLHTKAHKRLRDTLGTVKRDLHNAAAMADKYIDKALEEAGT